MQKIVEYLKKNLSPSFTKKQRLYFLLSGSILFLAFVFFTLVVRTDILRKFDFDTTVRLQDDIPVRFDDFFSFLSVTGRFELSIIILLILLFFKRKILGILPIFFFGLAHIIEIVGKSFLSQPGPPHMFLRTKELASEFPGLYIHTDASYPSGHSLRVVFIALLLLTLLYRTHKIHKNVKYLLTIVVVGYASLMLLSRVSLGEHWTTDVVGGSLLGLSFGLLSLLFL